MKQNFDKENPRNEQADDRISYDDAYQFVQKKLQEEPSLSHFIRKHDLHRSSVQAIKNGNTSKLYPKVVGLLLDIYSMPIVEIKKSIDYILKKKK